MREKKCAYEDGIVTLPEVTRIDADDEGGREKLLADGWREIELLETWGGPIDQRQCYWVVRAASYDIEPMKELARRSFVHDRLHKDAAVGAEEANEAKAAWVERHSLNTSGLTFVARTIAKQVIGFLCVRLDGSAVIIDLLAVDAGYRRCGVGDTLIRFAIGCIQPEKIRAGTQETNYGARCFYQSLGMKPVKAERTFHRP